MRFVFPRSHAFRRGHVSVDDDKNAGPECLVEFGMASPSSRSGMPSTMRSISPFPPIAREGHTGDVAHLATIVQAETASGGRSGFPDTSSAGSEKHQIRRRRCRFAPDTVPTNASSIALRFSAVQPSTCWGDTKKFSARSTSMCESADRRASPFFRKIGAT